MSVSKKVLEQKSNQELEKYIESKSRFIPDAILFAYEILESRGREFTSVEIERRVLLIDQKNKKEEIVIHPNHKKSADLIYLSGVLGIGNLIWSYETLDSGITIFIAFSSLAFVFGLGYFISKGSEYVKYVILITLFLSIPGFPYLIANMKNDPVLGILNIVQTILQVWAAVLLIKIPKPKKNDTF